MKLFRSHFELLRSAPPFRALFLAAAASGIGTYLAVVALIVDVYDRTESGAWVAALLIAEFLPVLVIGLLLGPLVDRLPRRGLMIGSDLLRAAVFAMLPFAPSAAAIVALAAVAGFATGFFRPAVYAGLPNLVADRDLPRANGLMQAVDNLTWLVGLLAGGAILAAAGPDPNYVLNAASFVASALLLVRIPARRLQAGGTSGEGHFRDLAVGFRTVRTSRALMTVLVTWSIVMVGIGNINVSGVVLVKEELGGGDFEFGAIMASSGLGLLLGALLGGSWVERRRMAEAYGSSIALMAVGAGLAAVSPSLWLAGACVILFGFGNGVASVCNPVLVQRGARDAVRGRAFTVIMSVTSTVLGLAMAAAGPLTDAIGARWVWGITAGVFALAAGVGLVLARPIRAPDRVDVAPATVLARGTPQAPPP
ncbi:MAG: MFS transporter [Thermoleophilia bacterium]|nr:MFS transporter [Thermoleophilia bacterium]